MSRASFDARRWQRIEEILDLVFDAPEGERGEILDQACGDDASLRVAVDALIAAEAHTGPLDWSGSDRATLMREALEDASDQSIEGSRLGPYRVDRRLGAGGMGVVYAGWDTRLERAVAIKILPPGLGRSGLHAEDRFLREARAASALDHPNICTIYDIGSRDTDGRLYLVMALYRGETLQDRLDRGPVDIEQARDVAIQIAGGLRRAHGAGIVHRDIKPANLFITRHGEVKILDFGLAKMVDAAGLTASGALIGTPAYMSPEQVRGGEVDARSDIWSFAVVFYEMLAGRRPFRTSSGVGALFAALEAEPDPLSRYCPEAPPEMLSVIERCLAKDPTARPQSMGDVLSALESGTSTGTERSGSQSTGVRPTGVRPTGVRPTGVRPTDAEPVSRSDRSGTRTGPRPVVWVVGALLLGLAIALGWFWRPPSSSEPAQSTAVSPGGSPTAGPAAAGESTPPVGLVVFNFHSLTPDPEIAALGKVITEMLVTDLRSSPDLNVAGTSRLHRAMTTLGYSSDAATGPDMIRRVSTEVGRDTALYGSFTRLGDRFRILATLERPGSETVLLSKQVEAHEDRLFNAVDELSLAVRTALEAGSPAAGSPAAGSPAAGSPAAGDGVRGVTTESLEAMRFYSEGLVFYYDQKYEQAIAALEKAVEIDPRFALAWRRLGVVYGNLGHRSKADISSRRAFELADRLPPKQRFLVQADHFGGSWATLARSIETYRRGLSLYPRETAWRNNLGYTLALVEAYGEALTEYQTSMSYGTTFGYAYVNAALITTALGRPEQGFDLLEAYADGRPGEWVWQSALSWQAMSEGRLDEADARLQRAQELVAEPQLKILQNLWRLRVLEQDWPGAEDAVRRLSSLSGPKAHWQAQLAAARTALFHGRSGDAVSRLQSIPPDGGWAASATALTAELWLQRGEYSAALEAASNVQRSDPGDWLELRGLYLAALAEQRSGDPRAADRRLTALRQRSQSSANRVERRLVHRLTGLLALDRGELATASRELSAMAELLPARGVTIDPVVEPAHVSSRLDLGLAALASDDSDAALSWLQQAASSGTERLAEPVAWTRSLFWLAEVHRRKGDVEAARVYFQRFLDYRADGDLDRELVQRAQDLM